MRANQKSSDIIRDLTSIARRNGETAGDVIRAAVVDGGGEPHGGAVEPEQEGELMRLWACELGGHRDYFGQMFRDVRSHRRDDWLLERDFLTGCFQGLVSKARV